MSTLNLSTNGSSISKSYQAVVNAPSPSGPAAKSPTFAHWAVFTVQAPLLNAFQHDSGTKESVLKVQTSGEGELSDLVDEFSDGRIQFAFVKVKDPNTGLPKNVLIAWCGEGVPERTKGYFTSHLAAVSKTFHGYHVQITARSDEDLSPETIVRKVADASGAKYSAGTMPAASSSGGHPPPVASKPVFTPTQIARGSFKPLSGTSSRYDSGRKVDNDGWGEDAPPVTRTQLEKVQPAYEPTKVNMKELTSQKQQPSRVVSNRESERDDDRSDVVKGGYQPIGKVDIAAIRRQAKESGNYHNDRPEIVKGSYEPVGKVDIAAIRARSQKPVESPAPVSQTVTGSSSRSHEEPSVSLAERSAVFSQSERLTSLPKPKVSNKFATGTAFTGTKPPTPGTFSKAAPGPTVGSASRTFADQGGKTPAQLWAERKARERGMSGSSPQPTTGHATPASPISSQPSGGEWKSGYSGKTWAPVQTTHTGASGISSGNISRQNTGQEIEPREEAPSSPSGGIGAIRQRFQNQAPMGAAAPIVPKQVIESEPPQLDTSSKPNAGRPIPIPGLPIHPDTAYQEEAPEVSRLPSPPPQPRSPSPPSPEVQPSSPIRIAQPVGFSQAPEVEDEQPPPVMPVRSVEETIPREPEPAEPEVDLGQGHASAAPASSRGKRALVQFDYEKAEDNEIELKEGEYVINIDMVDTDWWMGENARGETGLFPSNYVELVPDGDEDAVGQPAAPMAGSPVAKANPKNNTATATALYDYDAAEDNELSFPEGGKIINIEFPDEDWWMGEYNGRTGLFPANYVQLDE